MNYEHVMLPVTSESFLNSLYTSLGRVGAVEP